MQDTDGTRECLHALKGIGVRLAIDEFGAGYSSLSYLRQFPLDVLKIDRSFVSDLDTNKDAQVICSAILSIAHRLSLDAVADGIESEQQVAFLTRNDCQYGQGNYFSAPIEADRDRRDDGRERRTGHSTPSSHEQTHRREGRMRGTHERRQSHTPNDARRGASRVGRSRSQAERPRRRRDRHQAPHRKRAQERGALSHARGRRAEPPAVPGYRVAHRVRQRRVSRGGWLVEKARPSASTSPRSWASSASWSGNRITSARSRARPSATNRRARPATKTATFTFLTGRASMSRAKCAASSRWPRISRSGARFSSSSKPSKPSCSARTRISSNSRMSRRTT